MLPLIALYYYFTTNLFGVSVSAIYSNNSVSIRILKRHLRTVLHFLKAHAALHLTAQTDAVGYDALLSRKANSSRFDVVYLLANPQMNIRMYIVVGVSPLHWVSSAWPLFLSAGWAEREIWDLFGIFFIGHTDLRRILTDYGFSGHALRKDFPLIGFTELQYSEVTKLVTVSSVEQTAEFRNFHLDSPWFLSSQS